jgi:hypothetical protein
MEIKKIPISQLKQSPIRHEQLPPALTSRINRLRITLADVYSQSMNEWMDGFRRDTHPESEVEWWESLAQCYLQYTNAKDLSDNQKKAAFRILFSLAMGNELKDVEPGFSQLPPGAREEIMILTGEAGKTIH